MFDIVLITTKTMSACTHHMCRHRRPTIIHPNAS